MSNRAWALAIFLLSAGFLFVTTGEPSHTNQSKSQIDLKIIFPAAGTTVSPGDIVTVTVESLNGFVPNSIIVGTDTLPLEMTQPPFTTSFEVPLNAIGNMRFVAFGVASNGEDEAVSLPVDINVQVAANLVGLSSIDDSIGISSANSNPSVRVKATFDDGVDRNVSGSAHGSTYVSDDTDILTVDANGVLTGVKDGETTVSVFNGPASIAIPVQVKGVNAAPFIFPLQDGDIYVDEQYIGTVKTEDPDGTNPVLTVEDLPLAAVFTDNGDGTAYFSWIPSAADIGAHEITFIATDAVDPTLVREFGAYFIVQIGPE
jgi:hypothetical protein